VDLVVTLPPGLSYNAGSALAYKGPDDTGVAVGIADPSIAGNVMTFYDIADKGNDLVDTLEAEGGNDTLVLKFSVRSSCYTTQNVGLNLRYYDCCEDIQYSTTTNRSVTALFPSLSVVKAPVTIAGDCGTDVTWPVAVTNNGTGNAQVVRVEDTLGVGLTYVPGSFTTPDKPGTAIANLGGQVWGWEFNGLAAGATVTFTLDSTLSPVDCTVGLRQNNVRAIWGCGTAGDATDNNPATTAYDCAYGTWANAPTATLTILVPIVTAIVVDRNSPQTLYAGVDGRGIYKSSNSGQSWTAVAGQTTNLRIKQVVIHPTTSSTLFAATYGGGVATSTDAGDHWDMCDNTGLSGSGLNVLAIAIAPDGRLYVGTEAGVYRSADYANCDSWEVRNSGLTAPAGMLVIDPVTPSTLYAGLDGAGVYKSTDSGGAWDEANGTAPNSLTNLRVKAVVINPGGSTKLYAATYGGGVYKSINSGDAWDVCANTNLTNLNLVTLSIDANGKLYAGTEAGVFVSTDACATWAAMNNGLPN
jgi:uncharacterized repeat protein (TIGR01451 family)